MAPVISSNETGILRPPEVSAIVAGTNDPSCMNVIAPGIHERAVLLQVRPVPPIGRLWCADERLQAFLGCWIPPDIQPVEFKRGDDVLNLNFRRLGTRGAEILDHLRRDDRGEQAKN